MAKFSKFRFRKAKFENDKKTYNNDFNRKKVLKERITRFQKRTKHITKDTRRKITSGSFKYLKRYSYNFIDLLVKLGFAKHSSRTKILFVLAPLISLTIIDNIVIAFVITTINVFACVIMFSFAVVSKEVGMVNGVFDYGKYKYEKEKREVIIILVMTAFTMITIIFGHCIFDFIIQLVKS